MKTTKGTDSQHGAAALEFAIVLPILMVLVFGMIEFGVMFYDKAIITNASREGARAGTTGVANPDIEDIVKDYCNFNLINLSNNDFDPATDPNDDISISIDGSNDLTVKVEYRYDFLFSSILGFSNTTIAAETVMRME
jgi:Flp pilus assembly protein TadG